MDINFQLLGVNAKEEDVCFGNRMFSFVRNCQTVFQSDCFAFSPAMNPSSCYSTSSSAFGIVSALDFGHSNWCVLFESQKPKERNFS